MKRFIWVCSLFLLLYGREILGQGASDAKITVQVVDEKEVPITGATAIASFEGAVRGQRRSAEFQNVVDSAGKCSFSSPSSGVISYSAKKEGYYRTDAPLLVLESQAAGRWMPYDPLLKIVLKRVLKPIPMYARTVNVKMPKAVLNEGAGFDLIEADWVVPNGRGHTPDITFKLSKTVRGRSDYESELKVTFENQFDGIVGFEAPRRRGSELRSAHDAPLRGYEKELNLKRGEHNVSSEGGDEMYNHYYFRIRSLDRDRTPTHGALYGKIYRGIRYFPAESDAAVLQIMYYVNPMRDDTNIECDLSQNLFRGLTSSEEPIWP